MSQQSARQPTLGYKFGEKSDTGRVREQNEDAYLLLPVRPAVGPPNVLVLADGMGGEAGGAQASHGAVAAVREVFESDPGRDRQVLLAHAVRAANQRCMELQDEHPELAGLGTTLEILLVEGDHAWWAHVGDSRIYRVRAGSAEQLTSDHTIVNRMVEDGLLSPEDAVGHPRRNVLSRVVGRDTALQPDYSSGDGSPLEVDDGDCFVLCSDGLSDVVTPEEIAFHVSRYDPHRACQKLVELANARGGHDNVTVLAAYRGEGPSSWRRAKTVVPATMRRAGTERRRRGRSLAIAAGVVLLLAGALAALAWVRGSHARRAPAGTADTALRPHSAASAATPSTNESNAASERDVASRPAGQVPASPTVPPAEASPTPVTTGPARASGIAGEHRSPQPDPSAPATAKPSAHPGASPAPPGHSHRSDR